MATGRRISYFRHKHNLTQKQLGLLLGYSESTAEVRVNQYENGIRRPKEATLQRLSEIFGVDVAVFKIPEVYNWAGLMQTLFSMEDRAGWKIAKVDGNFALILDTKVTGLQKLFNNSVLQEWLDMQTAFEQGKITREEYDAWRYHYNEQSLGKHTRAVNEQLEEAWAKESEAVQEE
ncbi:helix-turn-helix domain-containing protein [uncultured Phascolarctobacterium sp.]|uniref:helix-turn-helix domain-containing protein n=1 Tax=uncultured Phascolarctobacterium sp. TaxID=512296 RepID=UPI0025F620D2|nr:helix-turn-helix transcriptional regulator [uncultured Phascolarctobacterium sp.]